MTAAALREPPGLIFENLVGDEDVIDRDSLCRLQRHIDEIAGGVLAGQSEDRREILAKIIRLCPAFVPPAGGPDDLVRERALWFAQTFEDPDTWIGASDPLDETARFEIVERLRLHAGHRLAARSNADQAAWMVRCALRTDPPENIEDIEAAVVQIRFVLDQIANAAQREVGSRTRERRTRARRHQVPPS